MNIKEALERVQDLQSEIKTATDLIFMAERDHKKGDFKHGEIVVVAAHYNSRYLSVPVDSFVELLGQRVNEAQAEIDRLQPVIDMANAALRGIEK